MPEVEHLDSFGFSLEPAPKAPEQPSPNFLTETLPSAFRLENDVMNALEYVRSQRYYAPTPGFDPGKRLRELDEQNRSALWETHGPNFAGVRSEEEFQARLAKIQREEADKQVLERSGFGGFLAGVVAGTVSPTIALPFIGNAKGLKAVAAGAGWGAAGGLAQELPLQFNQVTRTAGEGVFSVATSTVVSGLLGGAVSVLSKSERQLLEKNLETEVDMAFFPGKTAIQEVPDSIAGLRIETTLPPQTLSDILPSLKAQVKAYNTQEKFVAREGEIADYFVADAKTGLRAGTTDAKVEIKLTKTTEEGKYAEPTLTAEKAPVRPGVPDFETGRPVVADVFHGTAYNFDNFDPAKLGSTTEARSAQQGFFFSRDPRTANLYADLASRKQLDSVVDEFTPTPPAQIRMERIRLENPYVQDFKGGRRTVTYAEVIESAKAAGHDGVIFKNTKDGGPLDDIFVVFDAQQIAARTAPKAEAAVTFFDVKSIGKNYNTNQIVKIMNDNLTAIPHSANDPLPAPRSSGGLGGDVGAASTKRSAGKIASGVPQWIIDTSPVLRTIDDQTLPTASWTMAQLSDGGLALAGNKSGQVSATGGNLESLIKTYDALYVKNLAHIDEAYAEYFFGTAAKDKAFRDVRAAIGGQFSNTHMSKDEFRTQISLALWSEDKHTNPFVQKAAENLRKDYFVPMLKSAQDVGLIPKTIDLKGDVSYLLRDYDVQRIRANPNRFIEILAKNYEQKALEDFQARAAKLAEREGKTNTLIADLLRPESEVTALTEEFKRKQRDLEKGRLSFVREAEDQINALRQDARVARRAGDDKTADSLLEEARALEKDTGPMLQDTREARAEIKQRLRNLNKSRVVLERKQAKKLALVERLEEMNMDALETALRRGQRALNKIDSMTDEEFRKEVTRLSNMFSDLGARYDRNTEHIFKISQEELGGDLNKLLALEGRQEKLADKLTKTAESLGEAEDLRAAVPVFKAILEDQLQAVTEKLNRANNGRAVRAEKLRQQAAALDPAVVSKRIEDLRMASTARREEFLNKFRERGADDIDLAKGTADFKEYARAIATEIKDKVIGTYLRHPAVDLIRSERGAELARAINISSREISEFLNTNIDQLLKKSLHTLAPDIEIMRRFHTIDSEDIIRPIADEYNAKLEQFQNKVVAAREQLKDPKLDKATRAKLEKLVDEKNITKTEKALSDTYFERKRDIEAVYDRLRGTWGLPDDPEAIGYRLGKTALNLNVLRLMGGTMISSLADVGRPIMKHGLTRVFGDGFNLLLGDLKSFKASAREVRLAGAGLDVVTHARARALSDLMTDFATTSKFERGIEYASGKMGIIAMFDYWTSAMKQFSGVVANARFLDSVDLVINRTGTQKEINDALQFLASHNISGMDAEKIWQQMQKGGATKVRGTWLPDTEKWTDPKLVQLFRAAVVKNVDDTIIQPGVELPITMNKTIANRMLFQFKSFGMSSTYKTVGAGLQQRDMAVINGVMVSLAFGALSYYTHAMLAGGKTQETMMNADSAKWADEAIQRSGVLGALGDVQRITERLPYIGKYTTASGIFGDGERLNRNAANSLLETLLGPTFGIAKTMTDVIAGLEDPTQSTLQKARTLIPLQNLVGLRRLLDAIVQNSGLPERRD